MRPMFAPYLRPNLRLTKLSSLIVRPIWRHPDISNVKIFTLSGLFNPQFNLNTNKLHLNTVICTIKASSTNCLKHHCPVASLLTQITQNVNPFFPILPPNSKQSLLESKISVNPTYGRHRLIQRVWIVAPVL